MSDRKRQRYHSFPEEEFVQILQILEQTNTSLMLTAPDPRSAIAMRAKFNAWRVEYEKRFAMEGKQPPAILSRIEVQLNSGQREITFALSSNWLRGQLQARHTQNILSPHGRAAVEVEVNATPGKMITVRSKADEDNNIESLLALGYSPQTKKTAATQPRSSNDILPQKINKDETDGGEEDKTTLGIFGPGSMQ